MDFSFLRAIKLSRNRADFAALWAWLFTCITAGIVPLLSPSQDFRGYYAAAQVVTSGGNPYDYEQVARVLLSVTGHMGNNQYFYPPWFAWCFVPLTALPFETARCVWMAFNLTLWIVCLWQLSCMFDWPECGWRRWMMFWLATFIFAVRTFEYEQIGIVLLGLLIAVISAAKKQRWNLTGIFLALLLIKPNITVMPVMAITAWLVRRGIWRPFLVMCIVLATLFLMTTIATPDWYQPFFHDGFGNSLYLNQDGPNRITGFRINSTFLDWLKMLNVGHELSKAIYAFVIIAGFSILVLIAIKSNSLLQLTVASILINFAVVPYASWYDFAVLTIALFWAIALHNRSTLALAGKLFIIIFTSSVMMWSNYMSDGYWIVIGLCALVVWSWWHTDKHNMPQVLL